MNDRRPPHSHPQTEASVAAMREEAARAKDIRDRNPMTVEPDGQRVTKGKIYPRLTTDGKQKDSMFVAAITASRMPMIMTDPHLDDNPIIYCNQAFENLCGYPKDEIVGRNCRFLQGPKSNQRVVTQIRQAVKEEQSIECQILNYRKDGSEFWNSLYMAPIHDIETGELLYFFASQLDISYIHEAADRAKIANHIEALGHITAAVVHDLNNLLQIIMSGNELHTLALKKYFRTPGIEPPANLYKGPDSIEHATKRMRGLLTSLNDFSRRQRRYQPEPSDLNLILNAFMVDVATRVVRKSEIDAPIFIETSFTKDDPHVDVDRGQLEMAILNLLNNARDAMPDGGRIIVATACETVHLNRTQALGHIEPGEYVRISVKDEGVGIDPKNMPRVTDTFFTTKPPGSGTGLGLATVKRFIEDSDGAIELLSKVGAGTTVNLYLPLSTASSSEDALQTQDA